MRRYKRLLIVFLFLAVFAGRVRIFPASAATSTWRFCIKKIVDNKVSGLLIFLRCCFCLGNLIQIPGWIFLAAAVLALGRTWGGMASYVAAVVSCTVTFFSRSG
ncbi:hypothetical protein ACFS07_10105 [Undibacterium arcticum]